MSQQIISPKAWLNGKSFDVSKPIFRADSPAFLRGDALWEVLRIESGKMIGWELHFQRILQGLVDAGLINADRQTFVRKQILEQTEKARLATKKYACGKLYYAVLPNNKKLDILAIVEQYQPLKANAYLAGFRAIISDLPHPMLGKYGKSTSYQWSRIAQRHAEKAGANMAILLHNNEIIEATTAAVIWKCEDQWFTVRKNNGALPSTTVTLLEQLGIQFTYLKATVADLKNANSVVLVSALRLAVGLSSLDKHAYTMPDKEASLLRLMLLKSAK